MSRAEIDAAIRRHADTELLYDQPYEDPSRIRVTGPFTVESLSPHRVLAGSDWGGADGPAGEVPLARDTADFVPIILDNLRKAGVQNTYKNERLIFERIEPYAGTYVQAVGNYTDAAGKTSAPPSPSAPSTAPSTPSGSRRPPRRRAKVRASRCSSSALSPSAPT